MIATAALVGAGVWFSSLNMEKVEEVDNDFLNHPHTPVQVTSSVPESVVGKNESSESPITPEQSASIQERSTAIRASLSSLAEELDKHLEDREERKKIEAKYLKLTEEYNELAIQIVKANRQAKVADVE